MNLIPAGNRKTRFTGRQLDGLAAGLLLLLAALFLWRVVFLGRILLPLDSIFAAEPWRSESPAKFPGPDWNPLITDSIWASYPTAVIASQAARSGGLFWDPTVLAGTPALARGDLFSNPIYQLLALFLPPARAMSWMAVVHLFLGAAFMFLLLRELGARRFGALVGALAFAFNGYLIGWLSIPNTAGAMIWLPLIFWGFERALRRQDWRWGLIGALAFTLQILSGFLLWPFYAAVTFTLFASFRGAVAILRERKISAALRPWLYGASILIVGALLAAPWLLSTLQLFPETQRTEPLGITSFLSPGQHLVRLLAPGVYGNGLYGNRYRSQFNYSETDLYFGVLPLLFLAAGLFSRKQRWAGWFLAALGLAALLAVYNVFPFKHAIRLVYPLFLNTFPGRIFYIVAFAWAVVAGLGADWLSRRRPARMLKALSLASILLAAALGGIYFLTFNYPALEAAGYKAASLNLKRMGANNISLLVASALAALAALLFLAWRQGWLKRWAFQGIVLALIVSDLFWTGIDYNPAFDARFVFPETPSLQALSKLREQESQPYRVISVNSGRLLPGMTPEIYGLPTISGYSSWVLRRFSEYVALTNSGEESTINIIAYDDCCHPLINALNVGYVYSVQDRPLSSAGELDFIALINRNPESEKKGKRVQDTTWEIRGVKRRVLFEHAPGRVSFALRLQGPVSFTGYLAVNPEAWDLGGDGVRFDLIASPTGGTEETLFSQTLDPAHLPSDRNWIPVEVDLSRFAGQEITLSLVTVPGPQRNNEYDWAGWGEPKIGGYFPATLQLVYDGPNRIYRNPQALPRAWVVRRFIQAPAGDLEAVKAVLGAQGFDPAAEAVVEASPGEQLPFPSLPPGEDSQLDKVQVTTYAPQRVELQADLSTPGLLVLSDMMYPGWEVSVDGAPGRIYTTNLMMRGVFLPAGAHRVEFIYRPVMFLLGLWATSAALVLVAAAFIWRSRKTRLKEGVS